jgi:hypothetical protein
MSVGGKSLRKFIACAIAVLFAIAAEPGSMAMNAPLNPHAVMAVGSMPCHHSVPPKNGNSPCKGMVVCLGMLSCYGVTALNAPHVVVLHGGTAVAIVRPLPIAGGIFLGPDNPPPIA